MGPFSGKPGECGHGMPELEMLARLFGKDHDLGKMMDVTVETKKPGHLMAELAIAKLQSGEQTGMKVTAEIVKSFYAQTECLTKDVKNLGKKKKKLQKALLSEQSTVLELQQKNNDLQDIVENRDAQVAQQEETVNGLEADISDMLSVLESQDTVFNEISDAINAVNHTEGNVELGRILAKIAEILETRPMKEDTQDVSSKEEVTPE